MRTWATLAMSALLALVAACRPLDTTFEPPDPDFNRMLEQPRYEAYGRSAWFDDSLEMRRPPEGTVPFRASPGNEPYVAMQPFPAEPPYALDAQLLARGKYQYEHICAACHGVAGFGNPPIVARMELRPPPSLHTEKARGYTNEMLLAIVADGYGLMPSYEHMLDLREQVAVVHYLRALQLSQHAEVGDLPPAIREALLARTGGAAP